jgi:hypothetical protein
MKARGVFYYGKFVVIGIAFFALFTWVVMLLWNWLVPELFHGPELNYWQTLGILILAKILFAGMGSPRHRHPSSWKDKQTWRDRSWRHEHFRSHWKRKFEEKMDGANEKEPGREEDEKTRE